MSQRTILHVEDNANEAFLLQFAFEEAKILNPIQLVCDGREAIAYVSGTGPYADRNRFPLPGLMLLDLKLPYVWGFDVLKSVRQNPATLGIPVIIFSSSEADSDILRCCQLGANAYVEKPGTLADRTRFAKALKDFWLTFHRLPAGIA